MNLTQRFRSFFEEETWEFPRHERPAGAGSPATPDHAPTRRAAYAVVAILIGLTAGLGNALVLTRLADLQAGLALTVVEAAWLPTAYVMTNISANLLLIKFRQQYGLRMFTLIALGLYAVLSLAHLITADHWLTLGVRAASGFVTAALAPLCMFYVIQALPARWRVKGLIIGLGIVQCAFPLARAVSPWLAAGSHWQSLFLLEGGLAFLSFAAVGIFRLPPAERQRVFEPLDFLTFLFLGGSCALICAILGLGRIEGWFEASWIIWFLSAALPMLIAAFALEIRRTSPLLNLRWLASGDVACLALAVLMVRIVLSEQTVAAEFMTSLGAGTDDIETLSIVTLAAAVAGVIASAATVHGEKLVMPMTLAIAVIGVAAFVDGSAASLTDLPRFFMSQAAISFAAMFFLGPALVLGITSALKQGGRELTSFIVLFGAMNAIGALAGPAFFGTVIDTIADYSKDQPLAYRQALRLAALMASLTAVYLTIMLAVRICRRLAEPREAEGIGSPLASPGPGAPSAGRWRPREMPLPIRAVLYSMAVAGGLLIAAAFSPEWLPPHPSGG
jgi:MFS family permease